MEAISLTVFLNDWGLGDLCLMPKRGTAVLV